MTTFTSKRPLTPRLGLDVAALNSPTARTHIGNVLRDLYAEALNQNVSAVSCGRQGRRRLFESIQERLVSIWFASSGPTASGEWNRGVKSVVS